MPADRSLLRATSAGRDGWLTGTNGRAHLFADGRSACHFWTATVLDRPTVPGDVRCEGCIRAEKEARRVR